MTPTESAPAAATEDRRAVLLYDRECRFCRWSLRRVLAWDRRRALRGVALQTTEAEGLLADMDPDRRMASWHLVESGGRVSSAGRAAAPLLDLLPGGRLPAALARAFPGTTDRAYRFVADHRATLSRIVGRWGGG